MKKRKTIDVEWIKNDINNRLEFSTCPPEVRRGMQSVLESVLFETGNYRGFLYLESANSRYEPNKDGSTKKWVCDDTTRVRYI